MYNNEDAGFFMGLGAFLGGVVMIIFACIAREGRTQLINHDEAAELRENERCAYRGAILLRGQQNEFVCVKPGSIVTIKKKENE